MQVFLVSSGFSQIPEDYWNSADTSESAALRASLNDIITANHTIVNFNNSSASYGALARIDADPSSPGDVRLLYSGDSRPIDPNTRQGDGDPVTGGWNREHAFPQSFYNSNNPMVSDLHALFPADADINSRRSNSPYGEVSNPTVIDAFGNRSTSTRFEPRDNMKGDAARATFYMDVRYEGEGGEFDLTIINDPPGGTGAGEMAFLITLLDWHESDPVDAFELLRNDRVYNEQRNANPFVEHPGWVGIVYGDIGPPTAELANVKIAMVSTRGGDGAASKEYLVLANQNSKTVNLAGWELRSRAGTSFFTNTTGLSRTIAPFSHFIIADDAYGDLSNIEGVQGDLRVTSIVGGMGDTSARSIALFDVGNRKIDGFSWSGGADSPLDFNDGTPFAGTLQDADAQVYARKRPGGSTGPYLDTNSNINDLEVRTLGMPKTPPTDRSLGQASVAVWRVY